MARVRIPGSGGRPTVALLAGVACLLAAAPACSPSEAQVAQPLRFSHRVHAEEDMDCLDCHLQAEEGPYATLPKDAACMLCHEEAQGEDPAEAELLGFAERGETVPWQQVNRLPGHVYFSHGVHVRLAELECVTCHGDMTQADDPVSRSQITWLTMGACMDCHRERGASNDCLACHK